jgi:hypothetical protein
MLRAVHESVREVSASGALPVLVFDLDSTLFSTCPRNLKILEDFVAARGDEHPILHEIWPTLTEADMGWNVNECLQERGVEDEALLSDLRKFWGERFFTNEFCEIDSPIPGAPEFVSACHDAGAFIYYLTGRHVGGMEKGTASSLVANGFPLFTGKASCQLKPDYYANDKEFKTAALDGVRALHGEVVATFENEPGNANLFLEAFPEAKHFLLDTVHSPEAEVPDPSLIVLDDFTGFQSD